MGNKASMWQSLRSKEANDHGVPQVGQNRPGCCAIGLGTEHLEQQRETRDNVLRTAVGAGVNYKASECTECGVCVERCPFDVDVIAKIRKAVDIFEVKAV